MTNKITNEIFSVDKIKKNIKYGSCISFDEEDVKTDFDIIKLLEQYFCDAFYKWRTKDESFLIATKLFNGDKLEIAHIKKDNNQLSDCERIDIYINDKCYSITQYDEGDTYYSIREFVKSNFKQLLRDRNFKESLLEESWD